MPPYSLRRLLWAGPAATAAAVLANLLFFAVTRLLGERYILPLDGSASDLAPMPVLILVVVTLVPGLVATILFAFLVRFTRKPATVFLSISAAAFILSLGGPFNLPSTPLQTKILLCCMHILAAGIITAGIVKLSSK